MSKIFYITMTRQDEDHIRRLAEDAGAEVTTVLLDRQPPADQLGPLVQDWEERGADIILCKGTMEEAIRPLAQSAYVLGMRFSFDTCLALLNDYQKLYP